MGAINFLTLEKSVKLEINQTTHQKQKHRSIARKLKLKICCVISTLNSLLNSACTIIIIHNKVCRCYLKSALTIFSGKL